jgi:hypothetical protein
MQRFVLAGKASIVFRLIELKAKQETARTRLERELKEKRGTK